MSQVLLDQLLVIQHEGKVPTGYPHLNCYPVAGMSWTAEDRKWDVLAEREAARLHDYVVRMEYDKH